MCFCHYCSILGLFIGEILYATQKLIQCAAIGSVFTCLMFSFTVMLMLGVGLGYNQCYVEKPRSYYAMRSSAPAPKNWSWWEWWGSGEETSDFPDSEPTTETPEAVYESDGDEMDNEYIFEELRAKRSQNSSAPEIFTTEETPISPIMVVPLDPIRNIVKLLRKIRRHRINVTLQLIVK